MYFSRKDIQKGGNGFLLRLQVKVLLRECLFLLFSDFYLFPAHLLQSVDIEYK